MNVWNIGSHNISPGEKRQVMLTPAEGCEIPFTAINGSVEGKTVLVTAAVHGDEYPGVAAAVRMAAQLDPERVSGRILIAHCVNASGFWNKSLYVAEDGFNLNNGYPGRPNGTPGECIADFFVKEVFPQTDFVIDLHSGSAMEPLAPCLFFPNAAGDAVRDISLEAAKATSIPYLIASEAKTGHYSYAAHMGIPGLLLERGHSGLCEKEWVDNYCRDLSQLFSHLGVYPGCEGERVCPKTVFSKTVYLAAGQQGLWYPEVSEGQEIKKGNPLGRLEDFYGNVLEEYKAQGDGTVFYYTGGLAVKKGAPLVAYGLAEYAKSI